MKGTALGKEPHRTSRNFQNSYFYEHIINLLDLSTELQNAELPVNLLKSDSDTEALPTIFNILGADKGSI